MRERLTVWALAGSVVLLVAGGCAKTEAPSTPAAPCETEFDCEEGQVCVERYCAVDPDGGSVDIEERDTETQDVPGDTDRPDTDVQPDTPELGGLGASCDDGADCRSGYCILVPNGTKICTDFCAEGTCDEGYSCAPLADGADRVFLCFPAVDILCNSCESHTDCGGLSDLCIDYGFATFCGQNCEADQCPDGYECMEMEGPDGPTAQCRNVLGTCFTCDENQYDLNGLPGDGCEYFCEYQGPDDLPDPDRIDSNCDGIDGNAFESVFVAKDGDDANSGTLNNPMLTIGAAIDKAANNGVLKHVIVSEGTYNEQVVMVDGVSLWGGYSKANLWERDSAYASVIESSVVSDGRMIGVIAHDIVDLASIGSMHIRTGAPAATQVTNYGIHVNNSPALRLIGNTITAGPGTQGVGGPTGGQGLSGNIGGTGANGNADGGPGAGGTKGFSPCGNEGGIGGRGGPEGDNNGSPGGTGIVGTAGGAGGREDGCSGRDGANGTGGTSGADGGAGAGGLRGGAFDGLYWVGFDGQEADLGVHGNGGGGGGGGSGQGGFFCNDGGGNGGGGGGGGGCGGGGGGGGGAGGGSFGVTIVSSPGIVLDGNTIASSNGGAGGAGGEGGPGGSGAAGGSGGTADTGEIGAGGRGGDGGNGGAGGVGGGGAGGDSYAVFLHNTAGVDLSSNVLSFGSGGAGGPGGNTGEAGREGAFVEE